MDESKGLYLKRALAMAGRNRAFDHWGFQMRGLTAWKWQRAQSQGR